MKRLPASIRLLVVSMIAGVVGHHFLTTDVRSLRFATAVLALAGSIVLALTALMVLKPAFVRSMS